MKKLLLLIATLLTLTACGSSVSKAQPALSAQSQRTDVTEVLYFHGKKRCLACNAIEKLSKEVVDSLANPQIVMRVIDITAPENEATADKYEVTWSALIIDRNGKVENLTQMGFGYAKNQPQLFKAKLVEALRKIEK